eukprot:10795052-Lingulodinium_polyedra.AAC.1
MAAVGHDRPAAANRGDLICQLPMAATRLSKAYAHLPPDSCDAAMLSMGSLSLATAAPVASRTKAATCTARQHPASKALPAKDC